MHNFNRALFRMSSVIYYIPNNICNIFRNVFSFTKIISITTFLILGETLNTSELRSFKFCSVFRYILLW